jgi:hypothetical protein
MSNNTTLSDRYAELVAFRKSCEEGIERAQVSTVLDDPDRNLIVLRVTWVYVTEAGQQYRMSTRQVSTHWLASTHWATPMVLTQERRTFTLPQPDGSNKVESSLHGPEMNWGSGGHHEAPAVVLAEVLAAIWKDVHGTLVILEAAQ